MSSEPQRVIRSYLDQHGGKIEVPAHNLLSTWELHDFDEGNRDRITQALREAGIQPEPPLSDVHPDTKVTLRALDQQVASRPPWETHD